MTLTTQSSYPDGPDRPGLTEHPDEELLRRSLHELAEHDGPPKAGAVDFVLAKGRRARRLRRVAAMCGAAVLVASATGLSIERWSEPPSRSSVLSSAPKADGALAAGPARPQDGVRYRYDLSAACGLEYARFGGRTWQRDKAGADALPGRRRGADRLSGFMTLTARDTALFEMDSPALPRLLFRPVRGDVPCLTKEPERELSDAVAGTIGPASPRLGVTYLYDMPKACDGRYARFGGRLWRAEAKENTPEGWGPFSNVSWVGSGPLAGHMTLKLEDLAYFQVPGPKGENTWSITYRPVQRQGDECGNR
jgi:hypothetical protein